MYMVDQCYKIISLMLIELVVAICDIQLNIYALYSLQDQLLLGSFVQL